MKRGKGDFKTLVAISVVGSSADIGQLDVDTVSLTSTHYKYIDIGVGSFYNGSTTIATLNNILASTANSTAGIQGWLFDKDVMEVLNFSFTMPTDYKEGTSITPYILWGTTSSTGSTDGGASAQQYVRWGLGYYNVNLDSTSTSALAGPTELYVDGSPSTTILEVKADAATAISDTGVEVNSKWNCYIYRNATASTDSFEKDAVLYGITFKYQIDDIGSTAGISDK